MITLKIILMGLDLNSSNLGCSALGYSFLYILDKVADELDIKLDLVSVNYASVALRGKNYSLTDLSIHPKQRQFWDRLSKDMNSTDLVFDFTGGDSFTDIYGLKRFFRESFYKEYTLKNKKTLVLGPQTIGPFNKKISKIIAKHILQKSLQVFTRDAMSAEYARNEFGVSPFLTTDIAFSLPMVDTNNSIGGNALNIGINVSGLMWNGGYTGKNELGVSIDYHKVITQYIKWLCDSGYNVWLIPHVLPSDSNSPENDYRPMEELSKIYPQVNLAPKFRTPMEAKSYISRMDLFVGSRMHATIAAFSMRVPTIPIAYSRKFQGLYNSIGYSYVVDAKTVTTEQAIELLVAWTEGKEMLKETLDRSIITARGKNELFVDEIKKLLSDAANKGKE